MIRRALLLFAVPALMCAQTPRNRAPFPGEQWVKLFNGKDLTNWVPVVRKSGPSRTARSTVKV